MSNLGGSKERMEKLNLAAMDEESSFSDHDSLSQSNEESFNLNARTWTIPRFQTPKTSNIMSANAFTEGLIAENEVIPI